MARSGETCWTVVRGAAEGRREHRDETCSENFRERYLNTGFHLSPAVSQGSHSLNWGTVTATSSELGP